MGLQIAPCSVLIMSDAKGKTHKNSASSPINSSLPAVDDHEPIVLVPSHSYPYTAPASKTARILPHVQYSPSASTNDSQMSLSHVSHSTLLLSQCSSLNSLPSLGLRFGSDHMSIKGKGGVIVADHCCIRTLSKLGDQVSCVASPADNYLYSASSSAHAVMKVSSKDPEYLVSGQANYNTFGRKEGAVRALLVAGDRVFSSHEDLKIRVWARPPDKVRSCPSADGGDHKVVATMPTLWDCMTRAMLPGGYVEVRRHHKKIWIEHVDVISALALDKEEGCLYSASWDRSVKVWRLRDFKCIESFKAHDDAINTLAISPDGFLYTGSADSKIKVWARQSHKKKHCLVSTLEAHRSAVNSLVLSPDNSLLYSGACDKAIVVWEREDSAQHASLAGALRGHRQAVLCLVSIGNVLCSGSADKTIRVWHKMVGRLHTCVAVLEGHTSPVKCLSVSPLHATNIDTLSLYSGSLDHDIKVWRIRLTTGHVEDKISH